MTTSKKIKKAIESIKTGVKTKIPATVYWHRNHLDIDIDPIFMPFEVKFSEELKSAVKGYQKMGIHMDGKIHIFIAKNE